MILLQCDYLHKMVNFRFYFIRVTGMITCAFSLEVTVLKYGHDESAHIDTIPCQSP